ncbi:hypothetical protein ASF27_01765 [Methylobacterium sp. Leaf102]|uniref:hypothetical protein n=1 Tax=Methylobacterium sp. Leaf102 TaxID=1736253 RepID=UPI0006F4F927|nr:hypothetical protein [Methylobacterium sp. Leaf102]KQP34312.1 hypothetical protein ASF27_01765 [Methylobacterium sp. Leaf102]
MPDPTPIQQLDSWPAIIAAGAAAIAAVLVPLNGFVKTLLDYKAEANKGEALKPETAREIASSSNCHQLFDSMALADLTAAVKGLTAAIAADTASDEAHHANHLSEVLTRVTKVLDRQDEHVPPPRRGAR